MKTLKEFTFEALNADSNLTAEAISGAYDLYKEDQRNKILQNPPPPNSEQQDLNGYAQALIETEIGSSINPEQLPQYMAQYMGEPGITTDKFLNGYFNLMRPPEAVDPLEGMRNNLKNFGVEEGRAFEDFSIPGMRSMREVLDLDGDGEITWKDGTDKQKGKLASWQAKYVYNMYNFAHDRYLTFGYPFIKYIDQFPSMYRGVKETFGWEDLDIPILDDVAGFTGSFMLYEQEQLNNEIEYYKENGMEGEAAYTRAMKGATDTIVFLRALGKMRISVPGRIAGPNAPLAIKSSSSWVYRANQTFKALANSQKIALISAMSAEGVTMEDRVAMWKITSLYAATPAISGQFPGAASTKIMDGALNLFISERREGGLKDIRDNPNLSSLEKAWAIGEIVGYDILFSGLTQSYGRTANQISRDYKNMSSWANRQAITNLSPTQPYAKKVTNYDTLIKNHFGADWTGSKGGFFTIDKMEAEIKKTLSAEESVLRTELDRLEEVVKVEETKPVTEEVKPVAEEVKPVTEEVKPVADEVKPVADGVKPVADEFVGQKVLDNPAIERAVKKAILEGIEADKGLPTLDRGVRAHNRKLSLFDAVNAPPGTPVKTVINKVNNVRKNQPSTTFNTKQYYKLLEQTALKASTEGSSSIQKQIRLFSEFARENLPYRQADKVIAQLQKLAEQGLTPMKFNDKASAILDRSTAMQRSIDQVVGIKDMSKRVDMTEAEMLRTILKETSRAATGGYRSAIDKIVASQKVANDILKEMPPKLRGKMLSKMKQIASAKSDSAREKALNAFEEYSLKVVKDFLRKDAEANLNFSIKQANKLLKSGRVTKEIKSELQEILTGLESGKLADNIDALISKATTLEQQNLLQQLKFFTEVVPGKKNSELTPTELNAKAEMLNTLVKEMDAIIDAKVEGRRTKVQEDLSRQRKVLNQQKEVSKFWSAIKNPVKVITKEVSLIPRGNAESLDLYNKGTFTAFQDKLERSWIDIYRVQADVDKIMAPVSTLMEKKGFADNKNKMQLEVTTLGGKKKTIKLGIADRSRIYLAKLDPETWEASKTSGWKLGRQKFMLSEEGYSKIVNEMKSRGEVEISERIAQAYQVLSKFTDEASIRINGFPMALEVYTGPRLREGGLAGAEGLLKKGDINLESGKTYTEAFNDFMVEHSGRFKARTGGNKALIIYNPEKVLGNVTQTVSYYYGRGETLKEVNMFLQEASRVGSYDALEKISIKDQYANIGREVEFRAFETYIQRLNEAGSPQFKDYPTRKIFEFEQAAINYLGPRALGLNPKVAATQLASLPTAAAVMNVRDATRMYEAFFSDQKTPMEQMKEESTYLYARYNDGKIGYMYSSKGMSKKDAKYMSWITSMDSKVIGSIHYAMKQRAIDEGLTGKEMLRKAEEYTVDIMMKSQPTFEDVSRPLGALSKNPLVRMSFIFSSQRNKNYYLNYASAAQYVNSVSQNGFLGSGEEFKNLARVQINLGIATSFVALLNTIQRELRNDAAEQTYDTLPQDFYEYSDKAFHKKFAEALLFAQLGNSGAVPGSVASIVQYRKAGESITPATPYDSIADDVIQASKALKMTEELYFLYENGREGDLQDWWDKNGQSYIKNLSYGANALMIIPGVKKRTGNIPIVNAHKWFLEMPGSVIETLTMTDTEKRRQERAKQKRIREREKEEAKNEERKERERLREIRKKIR